MDLSTPALQSYKTNQNLAGWANETGQVATIDNSKPNESKLNEDEVSLSNHHQLIEWIAQDLPQDTKDTAKIVRAARWLFDHGSLEISDLKTLNETLSRSEGGSAVETLQEAMNQATSYSVRQSHTRLIQVFSTLVAASEQSAFNTP